jgi:hypothetical protein
VHRHISALVVRHVLAHGLRDPQQLVREGLHHKLWVYTAGIATVLSSLRCLGAGLLGAIATLATTTAKLAADSAAVSAQQSGDIGDGLVCFQEAVNLFYSDEMLVPWATWTWRLKRP